MPETVGSRTDAVPSLTARKHWKRYAAGMATEALFILALAGVSFVLAAVAKVVWR